MKHLIALITLLALGLCVFLPAPARANQVGEILVCYACSNTGNAAIDEALTNNPGVASDAILFAFVNTSAFPITGGVFSVSGASPNDSYALPTIAAGATFILIPGVTSDGAVHLSGGLFEVTGVKDTSDGIGGLTDSSVFQFTGTSNALAVDSLTAGSSTAISGTFTPADPGLILPYVGNPTAGMTSFIGLGPSGDGPCTNCYFGVVATLDTPSATTPEPKSLTLLLTALGLMAWIVRRQTV